ncbi:MAG: peptidoglycan-binding protein [Coriobacteriia bacterium]|nr:peptidoglycan-binding protein [Coriobacteriia bacterium]MCL2537176.1 peptidoglycan-binding protein [Coriobacteriia bacterium]
MTNKLAPSLGILRDEVSKRWPDRSKASDGWIGDARHAAAVSDHNPNVRGMVNAIDITAQGVDANAIIAAAKEHASTNYVVYNRKIYSRKDGFVARAYTGSNPHTSHIHISILQTSAAENNKTPWLKPVGKYNLLGHLQRGMGSKARPHADVSKLQQALKISADGIFGAATEAAVKAFQRKCKLMADGVVGEKTARALGWTWRGK